MRFTEEELSSTIIFFNELVHVGALLPVPDGYQQQLPHFLGTQALATRATQVYC
jgi:hypothetical protein